MIGMSAAIVQGVPGSTIDVDFWMDLPERQYMRPMNRSWRKAAPFHGLNCVAARHGFEP
jgi:hypothetical protein